MEVLAHPEQTKASMSVDDLGFRVFLDLFAVLVFGNHQDGHAQDDAFAAASILRGWHGLIEF